MMVGP
jgi:CspA family cold shock protein